MRVIASNCQARTHLWPATELGNLRSRPPRETSWPRRPTRRAPRRPRRRASATAMLRSRLLQISLGEWGTPAMHSVSSGLCKVLRVKTRATRPSFAQHSRCQSVGRWCHGSSVQVLVHVRTCEPGRLARPFGQAIWPGRLVVAYTVVAAVLRHTGRMAATSELRRVPRWGC